MNCYFSMSKCTLSQMYTFCEDNLKGVNVFSIEVFDNHSESFSEAFVQLLTYMSKYHFAYVIQESSEGYVKLSVFTHVSSRVYFKYFHRFCSICKLVFIH